MTGFCLCNVTGDETVVREVAVAAPPAKKNATVVKLLVEISDWMMTTGVGNNTLNNKSFFGEPPLNTS